jgi:hypothetical protein
VESRHGYTGHQRAAPRFIDHTLHGLGDDVVSLIDLSLDLVCVYFAQAPVGRIAIDAEKVPRLADGNDVKMHIHQAVAERRVEP